MDKQILLRHPAQLRCIKNWETKGGIYSSRMKHMKHSWKWDLTSKYCPLFWCEHQGTLVSWSSIKWRGPSQHLFFGELGGARKETKWSQANFFLSFFPDVSWETSRFSLEPGTNPPIRGEETLFWFLFRGFRASTSNEQVSLVAPLGPAGWDHGGTGHARATGRQGYPGLRATQIGI
jgi:hypothetical protein